ncbi:MAG: ferredoxin [Mollicutes bacterium]|nr:ferredoxin [Mollicutes bacterium]
MKKITLNDELCIGCGACVSLDGEHFDFNDEGKAIIINSENPDSEELVIAKNSCPVNAIKITENEEN